MLTVGSPAIQNRSGFSFAAATPTRGPTDTSTGAVVSPAANTLATEGSAIQSQVALGTRSLGKKLLADAAMQNWINEQIRTAAPRWIERYREDIRLYIIARVGDWNAAEMTHELERNIGRDLQFIRINGTLVGGLVGLAICTATQLARLG